MEVSDSIKELIAPFLKLTPGEIRNDTPVDRSAVKSSVLFMRMLAALEKEGFSVPYSSRMKTFADLLGAIGGAGPSESSAVHSDGETLRIGIDVESVNALPETDNYREDAFYKQTFSSAEISYCLTKSDPRASFAGKFAAKEALVKADAALRDVPPHQIEILNDPDGRPRYRDYIISITHTDDVAAAVAVRPGNRPVGEAAHDPTARIETIEAENSRYAARLKLMYAATVALLALLAMCLLIR